MPVQIESWNNNYTATRGCDGAWGADIAIRPNKTYVLLVVADELWHEDLHDDPSSIIL
jgi:hypothetical protein